MAVFIVLMCLVTTATASYWTERARLINLDNNHTVGSSIVLNEKEEQVNQILMNAKLKEFDEGFANPASFLPSVHFFKSKARMEQSAVFNFIKKIPKGASLHSHDTALVSFEYLYNLTYRDNLYGCVVDDKLRLYFFDKPVHEECQWKLIKELRKKNSSFDDFLKTQMTLIVDNPETVYPSITDVWQRFMGLFSTVMGMVTYRPVFQDYFYQALKELYEDNVMYIEFRGLLPDVYELNGTTYQNEEVVKLYADTLAEFKRDYPEFHGARFIYAPGRHVDNKTCDNYAIIAQKLKQLFPDFVAGFDLVGQEDMGRPLVNFVPQLLKLASLNIKFFFHAAETDWFGTPTDMNLFDAVLLNTTRIGHGFAIIKHPEILKEVLDRNIAIEVNPISNQVLKLVEDLRNHPANFLIAAGYPVVITCDDPSFWGAKALSYDWYMAFMGLSSRENDLRLLKQLAINSIIYSAMEEEEKCDALDQWEKQWDRFLDSILAGDAFEKYYGCCSVNRVR